MDVPTLKLDGFILAIAFVSLAFVQIGATEEAGLCVNVHNNYFHFFKCEDSEYCCGKAPHQRCCPKMSVGAIFGIVLTLVVFTAITVCSVTACCLWCHCCPYRRSRRRRWAKDGQPGPEDRGKPGGEHPLTLQINTSIDPPDTEQPGKAATANALQDAAVSRLVPLTPETPMSINSPTEFSKLIAHDWNRHSPKDEASPYTDTIEVDPGLEERGKPGGRHPLTLHINTSLDPTDAEHPGAAPDTDVLHGAATSRVTVDLYPPLVPLTPETPMSINSPTEFSKLIAHDWNRHRQKDEASPYTDTVEDDTWPGE